jgi:hypothetical protein
MGGMALSTNRPLLTELRRCRLMADCCKQMDPTTLIRRYWLSSPFLQPLTLAKDDGGI